LHYLESGKHRMDYQRYEQEGWPIGSGAIEATCKHLVKTALGRDGRSMAPRQLAQNHRFAPVPSQPRVGSRL
jgi:hypothetical protein